MKIKYAVAGLVLGMAIAAQATLTLTIDSYTTDELSLTISGTLDEDTNGKYLAIKNDWSNNQGVHTELFVLTPSCSHTITIGGAAPSEWHLRNTTETYTDALYFIEGTTTIPAGTEVSGSITFSGVGAFDPVSNNSIQLVSGFNNTTVDWDRLEATAVIPEPATFAFVGIFGAGALAVRRIFMM